MRSGTSGRPVGVPSGVINTTCRQVGGSCNDSDFLGFLDLHHLRVMNRNLNRPVSDARNRLSNLAQETCGCFVMQFRH